MAAVPVRIAGPYSVPRRFSLRSLLAGMGYFALLFALVRRSHQPPDVQIFYAVFLLLIGVAQMIFERRPRSASIAIGVVYLPLCFLLEPAIRDHLQFSQLGEHVVMLAVAGGFLAYLGGTLAAGAFLVGDFLALSRNGQRRSDAMSSEGGGQRASNRTTTLAE